MCIVPNSGEGEGESGVKGNKDMGRPAVPFRTLGNPTATIRAPRVASVLLRYRLSPPVLSLHPLQFVLQMWQNL